MLAGRRDPAQRPGHAGPTVPGSARSRLMATDLTAKTVRQLHDLLRRRDVSALEGARAHLDRIEALDESTVRSLLTVTRDLAEAQARLADQRLTAGEAAPLLG